MYAVIRSGGKQYRVAPGETVQVERLPGRVGGRITFEDVLAVHNDENKTAAGSNAAKAKVVGKIVGQVRGPKVQVMKFRKTKQFKILTGHRQNYTAVQVSEIQFE